MVANDTVSLVILTKTIACASSVLSLVCFLPLVCMQEMHLLTAYSFNYVCKRALRRLYKLARSLAHIICINDRELAWAASSRYAVNVERWQFQLLTSLSNSFSRLCQLLLLRLLVAFIYLYRFVLVYFSAALFFHSSKRKHRIAHNTALRILLC